MERPPLNEKAFGITALAWLAISVFALGKDFPWAAMLWAWSLGNLWILRSLVWSAVRPHPQVSAILLWTGAKIASLVLVALVISENKSMPTGALMAGLSTLLVVPVGGFLVQRVLNART